MVVKQTWFTLGVGKIDFMHILDKLHLFFPSKMDVMYSSCEPLNSEYAKKYKNRTTLYASNIHSDTVQKKRKENFL